MENKDIRIWSLRWWISDPTTGLASARKMRMFVWVVMIPFIVYGAVSGDMDWKTALALLGISFGDGATYAMKPPKG